MKHHGKRDVAELLRLLERERQAYELLLSLSRGQRSAFTDAGARGLMKVIAKKQEVMTLIRSLDEELEPYTSHWDATREALPEGARRAVSAVAEAVSGLIREILESERGIECMVTQARDRVGQTAKTVAGGLKAARAYRRPQLAQAGGILDGEG